ncbi:hypothetical protein OUZ56_015402 [Daphnia magna]|uniref:Uncharacterized protein n=1 Tax=Daphnia magna TaxID=35525 RepID=A0ABR0AMR3_9CRUS|nr:hypothetical protein OUZ56_015402 [Daphnia magna]
MCRTVTAETATSPDLRDRPSIRLFPNMSHQHKRRSERTWPNKVRLFYAKYENLPSAGFPVRITRRTS